LTDVRCSRSAPICGAFIGNGALVDNRLSFRVREALLDGLGSLET
jgi:hypothetical protein